jgi:ATP-binding cassette subfamily F protein 3
MDEPTNHLDMRSKGVLQEALAEFDGSYVIVSHDRDFLDPLVNKVVEFRRGSIKTYMGNVSDYLYAKQKELESSSPAQGGKPAGTQLQEKERKRQEAELRQRRYEKTRPVQQKIDAIEKSIEKDEAEKSAIEEQMGHPDFYKDGEKVKKVTARYKELEQKLPDSYFRWNELTKQLERINEEFSLHGDGKEGGKG